MFSSIPYLKLVWQLIALILAAYLFLVSLMFLNQKKLIYYPDQNKPDPQGFGVGDIRVIKVRTQDNLSLKGWYLPPAKDTLPVLLVFHGNAGHIGYRDHFIKTYKKAGMGVLLAEYRGYGGNEGKPHEEGLYLDARAYLQFLKEDQGIQSSRIVLYGESLGTGVAVDLATDKNIAAVILEAPYDSFTSLAQTHYGYIPFLSYMVSEKFDSISKISRLEMPKLFLIAEKDQVVPAKHALNLFQEAPEPKKKVIFKQAGHNNFYDFETGKAAIDFLRDNKIIYKQ